MNTPVSFKLAKLLKDKNLKIDTDEVLFYRDEINNIEEHQIKNRDVIYRADFSYIVDENEYQTYTIAEVVMWLYEKHSIWISIDWTPQNNGDEYPFKVFWYYFVSEKIGNPENTIDNVDETEFNSPTEAYEAAIEYCLNKLI